MVRSETDMGDTARASGSQTGHCARIPVERLEEKEANSANNVDSKARCGARRDQSRERDCFSRALGVQVGSSQTEHLIRSTPADSPAEKTGANFESCFPGNVRAYWTAPPRLPARQEKRTRKTQRTAKRKPKKLEKSRNTL